MSSVERPGRRLAIICEYSAIWSPSVIQRCGIGVERGVVRGVTTGEVNKLKVVGLITPLKGLRFRYDICKRHTKKYTTHTNKYTANPLIINYARKEYINMLE